MKTDVEYRFYQNDNTAPSWLFDISGGPKVCLSCIVGKNGDGKSSIIEMMLRVVNNFAYLAGFRENQEHLAFIPRVRATIKYYVGEKECTLSCLDDKVTLNVPEKDPIEFKRKTSTKDNHPKQRLKDVKEYLFFLFVSNYSLNSLNSNDFIGETGTKYDWLTPLFSKNDGYQTPVSLNPFREEGQINTNREHELSKQRLMSLFTEATEFKGNDLDNGYGVPTGEGYIFQLSKESKLARRTFLEYFSRNRSVEHSDKKIALDEKKHIAFWKRNAVLILEKKDFIESVYKLIKEGTSKNGTDFSNYLKTIEKLIANGEKQYPEAVFAVISFLQGFPRFSFLEFQRVFLVLWLERRWNESRILAKPFEINSVAVKKDNLRINAQKYIIYKTVSVFETYPLLFDGCISKIEKPVNFFAYPSEENGFEKRMEQAFMTLLNDICKDRTFITLKIRQCVNYLNNFSDYDKWNLKKEDTEYKVPGKDYTHYISFCDLLELIRKNTKGSVIDFLPPPIFEGEIILRSGSKVYPTSRISSGERQMLNMVGAVVYHLRNLSSSPDKPRSIRYKNIHLFLDEIELCFHPSYQRDLVNYLLGHISAAHLTDDMRISISLLTHSPFVLSDIPQGHVLYLREGKPVNERITINPFAANVNDILSQSFFMEDGFTGTFARSKVKSLIDFLLVDNHPKVEDSFWDAKKIEQFISIIGEPLLHIELSKLFWEWKKQNEADDSHKREIEVIVKALGGTIRW